MEAPNLNIMIVDDDVESLRSMSILLRTHNFQTPVEVSEPTLVIEAINQHKPDVILLDLHMPKVSGVVLLEQIKMEYPDVIVIIITADSQVDMAVKCTQLGAYDYFIKPIDRKRLIQIILKSVENKNLNDELIKIQRHLLRSSSTSHRAFSPILTKSPSMKQLFKYIEAISESNRPVLILGETGTGKELFAQAVHNVSENKGEFVTVNVAGLDDTTFSDSLFGHKKGAFTGAHSNRDGLIKTSNNGTLFLDEVGDLQSMSQIKLLRLLQENNYYPLGSDQLAKNTARIVTATNQSLDKLVESGEFRRDLFYRLHIHTVRIPPLRERREDIPLLTHHFLTKASEELQKKTPEVPDKLLQLFEHYPFPGNVRELEILLYDACVHTVSTHLNIEYIEKHLQVSVSETESKKTESIINTFTNMEQLPTIKDATERLIDEALNRTQNNQKEASQILGITRQALNKRLTRRTE